MWLANKVETVNSLILFCITAHAPCESLIPPTCDTQLNLIPHSVFQQIQFEENGDMNEVSTPER